MPDVLVVLLLATPLLAALACATPGFAAERAALSSAAALLIVLFVLLLAAQATQSGTRLGLGGLVLVDPVSVVTLLAVAIAAAGLLFVPTRPSRRLAADPQPWIAIHLLIGALLLAAVSAHALVLWLSLAASALLLARLGAGTRVRRVLPCALGLALAALLCLAPRAGGDAWAALAHGAAASHGLARLSFVLALLGFGAVAGLIAPWVWHQDAQPRLPSSAAPLVQVGVPACALQALARWAVATGHGVGNAYPAHLLLGSGLLSMAALVPMLLAERDASRLLALAGGAQVALIAAAWGLDSQAAASGGMLLLLCWSLTACGACPALAVVRGRLGTGQVLRHGALLGRAPIPGAALAASLLAYSWWAPSGAFLALFTVLEAAARQSFLLGLAMIALVSAVMLALAAQTWRLVGLGHARYRQGAGDSMAALWAPWPLLIPPAVLVLLGIHVPDGLAHLMTQAAGILGGGQ